MDKLTEHRQWEICPNCGESYVEEDVATRLLRKAESVFDEGVREDVRDY